MSELSMARWRIQQVAMLAFQFVVEILVDYVCVVMEIAAGVDFDRIRDHSSFLGCSSWRWLSSTSAFPVPSTCASHRRQLLLLVDSPQTAVTLVY